ncbi:MAG: ATP-dependent helicase [Eubacterium sp.]|nr:ATP-dependent helicase [Eubacterium sp.]
MSFNESQKQAVAHVDGPCLVLAGPGSGKTTTLNARTGALIKRGIPGKNILVVTFTRAAASSMKDRFLKGEGRGLPGAMDVAFGTFHSIFFRILRVSYGFEPGSLIDRRTLRMFYRDVFFRCKIFPKDEKELINELDVLIGRVKSRGISPEDVQCASLEEGQFPLVYRCLSEKMRAEKRLDFDDMQSLCYDYLSKDPKTLKMWRDRFRYILVDEFQDINPLQYRLVNLLSAPADNLFVVGDDDQSIYGFRGSDPGIMLGFEEDHPGTRRILLDTNYRCASSVVRTSLSLIKFNTQRFEKEIVINSSDEGEVRVSRFDTTAQEAEGIAAEVIKHHGEGVPFRDMAVLFRTNSRGEGLYREFVKRGIPCAFGGRKENPYEHPVARDIFAYFELAAGGEKLDRRALLRILNAPDRGIPRESVNGETIDVAAWLQSLEGYPSAHRGASELIAKLRILEGLPPAAGVNFVRKGLSYEKYLKITSGGSSDTLGKNTEMLEFLRTDAAEYVDYSEWKEAVEVFCENFSGGTKKASLDDDMLLLSTFHGSKGLEFDKVYITDLNDGICPYRDPDGVVNTEEERRLFYVAITRAKESVYISYVREFYNHEVEPSGFLQEMIEDGPPL